MLFMHSFFFSGPVARGATLDPDPFETKRQFLAASTFSRPVAWMVLCDQQEPCDILI